STRPAQPGIPAVRVP
ncbi:hypothetical protein E2320_009423, partial [Naja naja]